jgi:hypothetical protein
MGRKLSERVRPGNVHFQYIQDMPRGAENVRLSQKKIFPVGRLMTGLQQRTLLSPIAHRQSTTSHRPITDGGVHYDWRCA